MDKYKILKGQKLPVSKAGRPVKYPFSEMAINDAFRAPLAQRASIGTCARNYQKRSGAQFAVRKIDDKTVGVWRVA